MASTLKKLLIINAGLQRRQKAALQQAQQKPVKEKSLPKENVVSSPDKTPQA